MVWDPADFNNITMLRIPCHKLWLPDIVLYNKSVCPQALLLIFVCKLVCGRFYVFLRVGPGGERGGGVGMVCEGVAFFCFF